MLVLSLVNRALRVVVQTGCRTTTIARIDQCRPNSVLAWSVAESLLRVVWNRFDQFVWLVVFGVVEGRCGLLSGIVVVC